MLSKRKGKHILKQGMGWGSYCEFISSFFMFQFILHIFLKLKFVCGQLNLSQFFFHKKTKTIKQLGQEAEALSTDLKINITFALNLFESSNILKFTRKVHTIKNHQHSQQSFCNPAQHTCEEPYCYIFIFLVCHRKCSDH